MGPADHIFGPVIQIRKDLGSKYFWRLGQLILAKVYKTKVVVQIHITLVKFDPHPLTVLGL